MYFKQYYLGCLAHASYLVGSEGEAVVIDPQRDVEQYISEAQAQGLQIRYIIETHLHADFVSGHKELASRTGAKIVFGQKAGATFPHLAVKNGDEIRVGKVRLQFLETPGHTPESISIVLIDSAVSNQAQKIFTGDTLFIGDVGRPDLVSAKGYTAEQMAGMLYDSLHEKILTLDDRVEVLPAHGAGSMCGRNISKETSSTIGEQRKFNYALKPMAKEDFVKMMTTDLPEAPAYFSLDAEINKTGAAMLEELPRPTALLPEEVNRLSQQGYLILDVRGSAEFGASHIPNSLNIGLSGQFASWAGSLIPMKTPIIIVAESPDEINEAITRLARVGLDNVKGYLQGGLQSWSEAGFAVQTIAQLPLDELNHLLTELKGLQVIDVRRPAEFTNGHVPKALNAPLNHLAESAEQFNKDLPTAIICASGYRSSTASSILQNKGFTNLYNVVGGTNGWIHAGFAVE
jgi:glyoxylase-like metal-dependent hydrolase (beta-lactamase superfamily II)/rhodanese-related sulfurtransferase